MPNDCENCKANPVDILRNLKGADLSDKAKLVAILEAFGVTDREQVESILEAKSSTIRDARRALKIQRQKSVSDGNPAPEIRRTDENPSMSDESPAQTTEIQRRKSVDPSCARANMESFQDTPLKEIHSPPTPSTRIEPSEGETEIAHGVLLNCQTIRHQAFTISLPAIELGVLASGLSKAQIKDHCLAHALQWAAEIEAGTPPQKAVPGKIANFLSASIMSGKVRADVAEMRMSKAQQTAAVRPKSRIMEALLRSEASVQ